MGTARKNALMDRPLSAEYTNDEHTGDVVSLLEENARLRRLVVTLSDLILRNIADKR